MNVSGSSATAEQVGVDLSGLVSAGQNTPCKPGAAWSVPVALPLAAEETGKMYWQSLVPFPAQHLVPGSGSLPWGCLSPAPIPVDLPLVLIVLDCSGERAEPTLCLQLRLQQLQISSGISKD